MIETRWTLFDGRAGEDSAQVWLEAVGDGAVIRTQSWGPDVERHFGDRRSALVAVRQFRKAAEVHQGAAGKQWGARVCGFFDRLLEKQKGLED